MCGNVQILWGKTLTYQHGIHKEITNWTQGECLLPLGPDSFVF